MFYWHKEWFHFVCKNQMILAEKNLKPFQVWSLQFGELLLGLDLLFINNISTLEVILIYYT